MDGPEITQDGLITRRRSQREREVTIETEKAAPQGVYFKMKNGSIAGFRYFDLNESTHIGCNGYGAGGVLKLLYPGKRPVIASIPIAGTAD